MAEKYTSLLALVLERGVDDVARVVAAARDAGRVDRFAPVGDGRDAQEVLWGGRMQKAVVRRVEGDGGAELLRAETYVGADGVTQGMRRHAALLEALAEATDEAVLGVRDLSAAAERDSGWLARVAKGEVRLDDAITVHDEGTAVLWFHTHGAARFDVPDLELYGLARSQIPAATQALRDVHRRLLRGGMTAELALPDGTPVYLVPVIRAWRHLPLEWPGIGRAGTPRPGHDGPRATLSVLHPRRLGRYRIDLDGVIERL